MAMPSTTSLQSPSTKPIVALTGAFGGGLSTAAKRLEETHRFHCVRLSSQLQHEWALQYGDQPPLRSDLQRLGDDLRRENGREVLVEQALIRTRADIEGSIVIESVKNTGEIDFLRKLFGYRLVVVAVLSELDTRSSRALKRYEQLGLDRGHLLEDDQRDRNEEVDYGQQVELCIDLADVVISNGHDDTLISFLQKIDDLVGLLDRTRPRPLSSTEIYMHAAYSIARSSKCLKRNVGAMLVDGRGQLIAGGYNENPTGTMPCALEPRYDYQCHRDIVRNDHFAYLKRRGARCPVCTEPISVSKGPPWRCERCYAEGRKINLESFYFPDRALSWCTAIHAEVSAILAAGSRAKGASLYTTTFPCMQCAEKIIQAEVASVVYTEAYPDRYGAERLEIAGIPFSQFEGVRSSSAVERLFPKRWLPVV